jgi:hypothetical protein
LDIVNPYFKVQDENVFQIRKKEYENLEEQIKQILIPVEELGFTISEFGIKEARSTPGELSRTIRKKSNYSSSKRYA